MTETAAGTWLGPHLLKLGMSVEPCLAPHMHTSSVCCWAETQRKGVGNGSLVGDYHSAINLTSTQSMVLCLIHTAKGHLFSTHGPLPV